MLYIDRKLNFDKFTKLKALYLDKDQINGCLPPNCICIDSMNWVNQTKILPHMKYVRICNPTDDQIHQILQYPPEIQYLTLKNTKSCTRQVEYDSDYSDISYMETRVDRPYIYVLIGQYHHRLLN